MAHESHNASGTDRPVSIVELLIEIDRAARELANGQTHMSESRKIALRRLITANIVELGLDPDNYYGEYRQLLKKHSD